VDIGMASLDTSVALTTTKIHIAYQTKPLNNQFEFREWMTHWTHLNSLKKITICSSERCIKELKHQWESVKIFSEIFAELPQ
jgi:hypothetical protein